ncbi:hypothetical protein AZF37_01725 [endosymbiont 'TC1' of Trimyema compressum]|nr:hypothetical protein AZF37_01725 [endosymbiont 'TC1' of Trimyema compressum]
MKILIIIRHGMKSANKEGRYCGHLDLPLIEEGMAILKEPKSCLRKENISQIISSPLIRAEETSNLLFPEQKVNLKK